MSDRNDDLWIEVDLDALAHNYRQVRDQIGGEKGVICVVKANAYGHGLIETARAFATEGAPCLAVSHLGEGRALREAGLTLPILVMVPSLPAYYEELLALNLIPTVDSIDNLAPLAAAATKDTRFHLKINTGMNRFGLRVKELEDFLATLAEYDQLKLGGIFSHLAHAMKGDNAETSKQVYQFRKAVVACRKTLDYEFDVHLCNSAGAMLLPDARYDYVRVGTLLYGQYPSAEFKGRLELKDTWRARARIIETRSLKKGTAVGYGGDYICRQKMDIGIIPVGYTDGFGTAPPLNNISGKIFFRQSAKLFRNFLSGRANHHVYYEGHALPVLGRIAMQTSTVNLGSSGATANSVVTVPMRRTAVTSDIKIIYHRKEE